MYKLTYTGNQGDQQITADMQRLVYFITPGQQRHTRTQALLGLVHSSEHQRPDACSK